jgi:signal peptidase I
MASSPGHRRRLKKALGTAAKFGALLLALGAARSSVADQYHVPTGSMWPTIEPGDRIFVAKTAYGLRFPFTSALLFERGGPARGDVIVFADPRGGPIPLVKRVVALAGQTVGVRRGVLFVDEEAQPIEKLDDGRILEHLGPLVHEAGGRDFEDYGPVTVPKGHVFVMGDNRPASLDSRFMGTVPRSLVVGQVTGVIFRGEGLQIERVYRSIQ